MPASGADGGGGAGRGEDDDCGSLAWLLTFRLDDLVNVAGPGAESPAEKRVERPARPSDAPRGLAKPAYTYPELIEKALRERGELTVSEIYQWISDRFPYYKVSDERWKNSVRHNLSINPHFRKGARASHGAGHLWRLAASALDLLPVRGSPASSPAPSEAASPLDQMRLFNLPKVIVLDEAAVAAASILPDQDIFTGNAMFLNPVSSEQVVRECGLLVVD